MPASERSLIFSYTTKPAGKGTGLGLSVFQNILKDPRGPHCLFECPPEGGTVFTWNCLLAIPASPRGGRVHREELFS